MLPHWTGLAGPIIENFTDPCPPPRVPTEGLLHPFSQQHMTVSPSLYPCPLPSDGGWWSLYFHLL